MKDDADPSRALAKRAIARFFGELLDIFGWNTSERALGESAFYEQCVAMVTGWLVANQILDEDLRAALGHPGPPVPYEDPPRDQAFSSASGHPDGGRVSVYMADIERAPLMLIAHEIARRAQISAARKDSGDAVRARALQRCANDLRRVCGLKLFDFSQVAPSVQRQAKYSRRFLYGKTMEELVELHRVELGPVVGVKSETDLVEALYVINADESKANG
jgi:hypothetical protein